MRNLRIILKQGSEFYSEKKSIRYWNKKLSSPSFSLEEEEAEIMMRVFDTYLYEISKGTKPAALLTCENALLEKILQKLKRKDLSYFVQNLDRAKVNIFFGNKECIDVIEKFLNKPMYSFSPLEDFILGAILGYDIKLQCKRLIEHNKVK